jgi:hypothetical protein
VYDVLVTERVTEVVSLRDCDGRDPLVVRVDRAGPWGNPFPAALYGGRERCLGLYCEWLLLRPDVRERARSELRGRKLACWCSPMPCHADVLAAVVEGDLSYLRHWGIFFSRRGTL